MVEKMLGSFDQKTNIEDTDLLAGYDMTANKVKNFKFSGIWTWIVSKLKGESISDLNTTNKTVVGAIKEVNTPTFTPATSRANINSGESQSIIMGKIKKWLADLGTAAFCSVVNNLTTTAEGSVLDARQGKNLSDALTNLNTLMGNTDISAIGGGTVTGAINELNSKAKILKQIKTGIVVNVDAGQYKGGSLLVFGRKNPNGVIAFLVSYFRNKSSDNLVAKIVPLDGKTYTAVCDNAKITITGDNLAIHSRMTALSGDGFIHSSVEAI